MTDAIISGRHADFCDLVERLAVGEAVSNDDRALLEEYASPGTSAIEKDQLDHPTVEMVAALTGRPGASNPNLAARALLVTLNLGLAGRLGPIVSPAQ